MSCRRDMRARIEQAPEIARAARRMRVEPALRVEFLERVPHEASVAEFEGRLRAAAEVEQRALGILVEEDREDHQRTARGEALDRVLEHQQGLVRAEARRAEVHQRVRAARAARLEQTLEGLRRRGHALGEGVAIEQHRTPRADPRLLVGDERFRIDAPAGPAREARGVREGQALLGSGPEVLQLPVLALVVGIGVELRLAQPQAQAMQERHVAEEQQAQRALGDQERNHESDEQRQ